MTAPKQPASGAAPRDLPIPSRSAVRAQVQLHWGVVMSVLVTQLGELARAEQAMQAAADAALAAWSREGAPAAPRLWLLRAARREVVEHCRREQHSGATPSRLPRLVESSYERDRRGDASVPDQRLLLMLGCTHPDLDGRVSQALLLRYVCGVDLARVAATVSLGEVALAQQLRRAHRVLRAAPRALAEPPPAQWPTRRDALLSVIENLYRVGGVSASAERGTDPVEMSLWLAQLVAEACPDDTEVQALRDLLNLEAACEPGRYNASGAWLELDEQDPDAWDQRRIHQTRLRAPTMAAESGPYGLRAAIAAERIGALALSAPVDWSLILGHQRALYRRQPDPVLAVEAAASLARVDGPRAGLAALDELASQADFDKGVEYWSVRAEMLAAQGDVAAAHEALEAAIVSAAGWSARERGLRQRLALMIERPVLSTALNAS